MEGEGDNYVAWGIQDAEQSLRPGIAVKLSQVQGGQLNMALCFWYLVKSDLFSVPVYSSVQGTRKTRPCLSGRVVLKACYLKPKY